MDVEASKDVELLKNRLRYLKEPYIKSVILFGSMARGESRERSDVDLLVLHEGCEVKDPVVRRSHLYNLMREAIGKEFKELTVIDIELERFLKPKEINATLLNIYWDGFVVYDRTKVLQNFLEQAREKIVKCGLKRVRDGRAYYWVLPEPLKEVEIL